MRDRRDEAADVVRKAVLQAMVDIADDHDPRLSLGTFLAGALTGVAQVCLAYIEGVDADAINGIVNHYMPIAVEQALVYAKQPEVASALATHV